MDLNEIYEYCTRRHVHLCSEKDYDVCPFREAYKDRHFCTVSDFLVDYYVGGGYQENINQYFEQACPRVRDEMLEQQQICEEAQQRREILLNNAAVGDTMFCVPKCDDVVLLEKNADFSGRCRCKTLEGEEFLAFPDDLNPIAKGTKYSVFKTKFVDQFLEFRARKLGFRVKQELVNGMFVFTFFGDSQQKVDDFVRNIKSNQVKKQ